MPDRTHSPVAVVAGGSAGVGRACVEMLLTRGLKVAVLARGQGRLDEMHQEFGDRVWTRSVDVSDALAVNKAAHDIAEDFGTPEIWINSAMLTSFSPFEQVDDEEFRRITDTTYLGTVNGCRAALSIMARGNIVNVGSGLAYASVPFQAAYCGAKHAIEGFTQALRIELARAERPITLSMVQLPAVNTPQFDWARNRMDQKPQPAPPVFAPEVAAKGILHAIDTDAREVLVGRSMLQLIAGNMVLPDLMEKQLAKIGVHVQKSKRSPEILEDNLDEPLESYPSKAEGSYGHIAETSGLVVDGDMARKALAFGGGAALLAIGVLLGRVTGPSGDTPARASSRRTKRGPNWMDAPPDYQRPAEYRR
ncbi:Putative oxidoreductase SadH [Jannaschia seosinensis]|uniref:Putative oxidoreductase SadH n=1 Tax=Jannaschia seosinensis TaxID=313367 RepID=A0A0M7B862_9RHOB|nr:SDR family oxidoreductase [Jannaschia seosinensis]CUH13163.1 Putative oxidoreductase SadH [Jannaschia seosinensis]